MSCHGMEITDGLAVRGSNGCECPLNEGGKCVYISRRGIFLLFWECISSVEMRNEKREPSQ
jgi:hypothetical protein